MTPLRSGLPEPTGDGREKRREPRRRASGVVHVRFNDTGRQDIEGSLVNVSDSGFRMSHNYQRLRAGTIVEFRHAHASGRARVIWNRVSVDAVETGLLLVQ